MPPLCFVIPLSVLCLCTLARAAEGTSTTAHPGAVIYQAQCASCHGKEGEGVAGKYDEPLIGDRSLESLTRKIDRTMPEEDPDLCVGEDARQVALYIYDAFYSPAAQARVRPPSEDLTRLTVDQFRTSVTDIIAHFRGGLDRDWGADRGLTAVYRSPQILSSEERAKLKIHADPRKKDQRTEGRVTRIDFDWGSNSPDPEKLDPDEFDSRFEGSLIAPETGVYEFVLKTPNGARLWSMIGTSRSSTPG
jgi:hypothetical protein